jgi:hypothetical protein
VTRRLRAGARRGNTQALVEPETFRIVTRAEDSTTHGQVRAPHADDREVSPGLQPEPAAGLGAARPAVATAAPRSRVRPASGNVCTAPAGKKPPANDEPEQPADKQAGDHEDDQGQYDERHWDRERQRHHRRNQGCQRRASACDGRTRQVRDQPVQLTVGLGGKRGTEAVVELIRVQAPLRGRLAQPLGYLLAIRIRCPERCSMRHGARLARAEAADKRGRHDRCQATIAITATSKVSASATRTCVRVRLSRRPTVRGPGRSATSGSSSPYVLADSATPRR